MIADELIDTLAPAQLRGALRAAQQLVVKQEREVAFKQAAIDKLTHENAILKRLKFAAKSEALSALAPGSTLRELVERIELPMLFVATDGRVAECNPAAAAVLDQPPLWLRSRPNGLWLRTAEGWAPVRSALGRLSGSASLVLDLVSEDRRCATLELRLVHGAATDQQVKHPVYAVGTLTRGPRDRERALRALYGLTAAEARVSGQIAEGLTPSQIVALTGLSITTVRTHLAAARQKLGVTRQAQIAARVLGM